MSPPLTASLVWKLRQHAGWQSVNLTMPASSASRVACTILREFGAKRRFTPTDLDVTGEFRRFAYRSDAMVLTLRLLK